MREQIKKVGIVMIALIIAGLKEVYADFWTTKVYMPTARAWLAIGVVNNKIYAIGGYNGSYLPTNEEYDPQADLWTTKANIPMSGEDGLAIGVVNNKIYAIGGYYGTSFYSNINEEYDPATDSWTSKAPMATGRGGLAIGVVYNKIYAIGGYNGSYLSTNDEYDPVTNTWQAKAPMPTARRALAIGVVNNKIYAIGGWNGSSYLSTNEEYDPVTNTWQAKAPMPTARQTLAIGVVYNKIYAIGGWNGNNHLSTNEEYDPQADSWTTKANMPTARDGLAIGVVNNKIYAIGGFNGSYLSTNEEYIPHVYLTSPNGGEIWNVGAIRKIICEVGGVDYYLSIDGGYNWTLLAKNADDTFSLRVPHTPTRYALIKVVDAGYDPYDPAYSDVSDSFFTINSTITLLSFSAKPTEDGIELEWQTDPSLPDLKGYDLYVSKNSEGSFERVNENLIEGTEYFDKENRGPSLIYRLSAVNGWDMEYIVGEIRTFSVQKALLVYPNVIKDRGVVFIRVPDLYSPGTPVKIEVSIYNLQGQKIKTIKSSPLKPGFYSFNLETKDLPNGEYFVLMKTPDYTKKTKFLVLK